MADMESIAVVGLVVSLALPLLGALLSALGRPRLALMVVSTKYTKTSASPAPSGTACHGSTKLSVTRLHPLRHSTKSTAASLDDQAV